MQFEWLQDTRRKTDGGGSGSVQPSRVHAFTDNHQQSLCGAEVPIEHRGFRITKCSWKMPQRCWTCQRRFNRNTIVLEQILKVLDLSDRLEEQASRLDLQDNRVEIGRSVRRIAAICDRIQLQLVIEHARPELP